MKRFRMHGVSLVLTLMFFARFAQAAAPTVTVSPGYTNLGLNSTLQYTAAVTGLTNQAVTWEVNGVAGGNATIGTISATGLYKSPAVIPTVSTLVEAVASDGKTLGVQYVNIEPAGPAITAISPSPDSDRGIFGDHHGNWVQVGGDRQLQRREYDHDLCELDDAEDGRVCVRGRPGGVSGGESRIALGTGVYGAVQDRYASDATGDFADLGFGGFGPDEAIHLLGSYELERYGGNDLDSGVVQSASHDAGFERGDCDGDWAGWVGERQGDAAAHPTADDFARLGQLGPGGDAAVHIGGGD
jgi:hypothetical protein